MRSAHAAGDPGVTIADYSFSPGSITVHVGDTVSWTNNGQQPHTATANDHSFDTGTLKHGQNASHTFTQAGTFAYICTVHPYMHGTVVVQASSSSTTPSGTSGGSGSSGSSGSTASTLAPSASTSTATPSLPNTGTNLLTTLLVAAGLIAAGLGLRRYRSSKTQSY